MLTMPEFAFLALCRLARPLASPGPRCSSVDAGVPLMRKEPSAAPVTTPSNRPSTQRMPSTRSRAATKCISEVPGLAKQTSTPPATKVRTRLSAPFIVPLPPRFLKLIGDQSFLARFVKGRACIAVHRDLLSPPPLGVETGEARSQGSGVGCYTHGRARGPPPQPSPQREG